MGWNYFSRKYKHITPLSRSKCRKFNQNIEIFLLSKHTCNGKTLAVRKKRKHQKKLLDKEIFITRSGSRYGYGSESAKICGSTDPDPRGKISTKNCKKKNFYS